MEPHLHFCETWEIIIGERPFLGTNTQSLSHNIVLDILLALGLFGLLAYGFLAFLVGMKLWRAQRSVMVAISCRPAEI